MQDVFVERLSGYGPLTAADRAELTALCEHRRTHRPRYDLIREGDEPGPVFVMTSGWACRYKLLPDGSRQIVAFLMPGDFCDMHVGILREMDHSIATLTDAEVATISREKMEELVENNTRVMRAFWWAQLVDEGVMRAWIVSMGRRSSVERIAHLTCELYLRMRNVGLTTDHRGEMPLTQLVLADALGLTPIHVNRVLRDLRTEGIMELTGKMLIIHDPDRLSRIAGFDDNYLHRRLRRAA